MARLHRNLHHPRSAHLDKKKSAPPPERQGACGWDSVSQSSTELTFGSNAEPYSQATKPVLFKFGKIVQLVGAVCPVSEVASGGELVIGTIPDGFRPQIETCVLCQGSSFNTWLLRLYTNGNVVAQRHRSGAGQAAAIPTSAWLTFSVAYVVS